MGGGNLHRPQSIFNHIVGHQPNGPGQEQVPVGPWPQEPQVPPMSMPWSIPIPQQPEVMRFLGEYAMNKPFQRKRKSLDCFDDRSRKQFITEEKMAAHFQGLQISPSTADDSRYAVPSTSKADPLDIDQQDIDMDIQNQSSEPRLVISEELKKIQQEPLIPISLLSKLERPTMALVLWEPPGKHLRVLPTTVETPGTSDDNNNSNDCEEENNNNNNNNANANNNNASIPDMNVTVGIEPMEL